MRLYNNETRQKFFDALYNNYVKGDIDKKEIEKIRNTYLLHIKELENTLFMKTTDEIQRYITSEDIKAKFTNIINDVLFIKNNVDSYSFEAFRETYFDEGRNFIEIDLLMNGMDVAVLKEGERIEISKFKSDTIIVKEINLGGAIEINKSILETGQFNRLFNILNQSAISYLNGKYKVLYKLLYNSASQNPEIPYQTGSNELEKTIKTINYAVATIKNDFKEYNLVNYSYPIYVYAHPNLEGKLEVTKPEKRIGLNATTNIVLTGQPLQFFYTYELGNLGLSENKALFVLPKLVSFFAQRIGGEVLTQEDILSFSNILSVRGAIAAIVADTRACRIVNFA